MAGTTLGTAYVQIVPSAQGIQGSITNALSGEGESAGTSLGSKVVSFAKKAIVAGTVGKVLKDTLIQGADLEQLKGGIEKIFDGANTSQIFTDASNAYKDLNLSANDYLSTITSVGAAFASSMGDQKGYDVARAGMLAVSDFATGTGKNVDLLNEKFQMISRSTSSYQSIADQFAGLLPQTSSDFLAQAQAAGFLSDKYTSLTDVPVDEYQQALVQMMQQGTASMGLAGNTAAETEKTFSGSFAAMKASAQNFLGSLASGENVGQSMSNLMTSVSTFFFSNFLPMIGNIVKSLPGAIYTFLQQGVPTLLSNISTLISTLSLQISSLARSVTAEKVQNWVTTTLPKIVSAGASMIGRFAATLIVHLPKIVAAIGKIGLAIVKGLGSALWGKIKAAANGIKEKFLAPINAMKDKVKSIIDKVKSFFPFKIGKVMSGLKLPHFSISGKFSLTPPSIPKISVSWYKKAENAPYMFGNATLFGAGEHKDEILYGRDALMRDIREAVGGGGNTVTINVTVNGADDPEDWARRLARQMQLEMRTI